MYLINNYLPDDIDIFLPIQENTVILGAGINFEEIEKALVLLYELCL